MPMWMRHITLGASLATAALFSSVASAQTFELNVGSMAPAGSPWHELLLKMEAQIEKESGGRINMIIRPPGLMGEVEMVREARKGERLQAAAVTTAAIAEGGNAPLLQLVELPFLFKDNAEADRVMDGVLFDPYADLLRRRGFELIMWSENGWRSFATKGKPIKTPADVKNFKMRAQESEVHMAMYRALGTQAVQKPMTEVLTSLQSNVIDGLDNTALYIQAGGLGEPLDYFTMTRHIYQPAAIVISKRWFDTLPDDLKKIVQGQRALTDVGRKLIRDEDAAMVEVFEVYNVEVINLNDAERKAFADATRPVHAQIAGTIEGGPELLKKINSAIAR